MLVLLLALLAPVASLQAQTGVRDEFWGTCRDGGLRRHEIQFIGTAGEPETYHFSGAAWVEEARQNLLRAEASLNVLQTKSDPKKVDPNSEFGAALMAATIAMIRADEEFDNRTIRILPPYSLTLIPMVVEQRLSGDPDAVTMVYVENTNIAIRSGERYVISGIRTNSMLPPLPEMGSAGNITEYVEVLRADLPDAVARDLEWLASLDSNTAIVTGGLTMQNFGDGVSSSWATEFRGTRIVVSSGAREVETAIAENGRFELRGLPPGRLHIRADLPRDLTLTSASKTTIDLPKGGCAEVRLTVNLNGRVRGRITTAAPQFKHVKLVLQGVSLDQLRTLSPGHAASSSHSPRVESALNENGTFELYGAPPGWYVLSASVQVMTDGKERHVATYYPGTPHMGYATPIEIGRATVHEGFDFVVAAE